MRVIDGKDAILGRLASFATKEALKGEDVVIVNCEKVKISGSKKNIEKEFGIKRARGGSAQKGPYHSKLSEKIVKRVIRGMLPNYREGRGSVAYKRIICYDKIPKEFESSKKINLEKREPTKSIKVEEISK